MLLYRYTTSDREQKVTTWLHEYAVLKETKCGYWFIEKGCVNLGEKYCNEHKRWVSKTARKRFCYPTKEEAFESYKRRTEIYCERLEYRLKVAKAARELQAADDAVLKPEDAHFVLF